MSIELVVKDCFRGIAMTNSQDKCMELDVSDIYFAFLSPRPFFGNGFLQGLGSRREMFGRRNVKSNFQT